VRFNGGIDEHLGSETEFHIGQNKQIIHDDTVPQTWFFGWSDICLLH
jgi:hypothetical protein